MLITCFGKLVERHKILVLYWLSASIYYFED